VWEDECVCLILQPPGGDDLYDFWVNANGAVNDARASIAQPWGGRDESYSPPLQAAASIGDGFWEVEMALPWTGLYSPPDSGVWRACVGRQGAKGRDKSAWNPTTLGFHVPDTFGYLRFVAEPVGLTVDIPARLNPGANVLKAVANAGSLPLSLMAGWQSGDDGVPRKEFGIWRTGAQHELDFDIAEGGRVVFTTDVLDAATLQPLYLSAEMARVVEASTATLQIATDGRWQAHVNGVEVASGSGGAEQVSLSLSKGTNVVSITFECGSGAFAGEFQGMPLASDGSWVMAGAEPPDDFHSPAFDDTELPRAAVLGDSTLPGARLIGAEAGPVTVRKTLLCRQSRLWPKPAPYLHLAQYCPQALVFPKPGIPDRLLHDWRLHIALPPGLELLGATGFYHQFVKHLPVYTAQKIGTRMLDGEEYSLWVISADKPVKYDYGHYMFDMLDVFVRANEMPAEDSSLQIAYWLEAEQGAVIEAPQYVPLKVLPPLDGKQPQKLRWQFWMSGVDRMDDHAMREVCFAAAQQAGFNERSGGDEPALSEPYNLRRVVHFHADQAKGYVKAHPEHAQVTLDGKRSERILSPAYWLQEGWPAVEEALGELLARHEPDSIIWDVETNSLTGYMASYDERYLREFAEFAQLGIDPADLTPETIKDQYYDQWLSFIGQRFAEICLKMKEAIHRLRPGTQFQVYSGYQSRTTQEKYSVDWEAIGRLKAIDVASCGYGRGSARLRSTREALGDIPLMVGIIINPYRLTEDRPVIIWTKARVLRRLTDCTAGVLFYDRHALDGRCYHAIADVSRLAADYEDIFLYGKFLEQWGELGEANLPDSAVREYNGKYLVAIMNETGKAKSYSFHLPQTGFTQATEYYSGQRVVPGQAIELELPPGEVAAYVLE